jgi:SAM-dependent methyltransferase
MTAWTPAITVNTIYFVDDLDRACSELARVLRPGGRLVVGIGDPEAMARMPFSAYGFLDIAIPHNVLIVTRSDEGLA